jgi:hypothetical protein
VACATPLLPRPFGFEPALGSDRRAAPPSEGQEPRWEVTKHHFETSHHSGDCHANPGLPTPLLLPPPPPPPPLQREHVVPPSRTLKRGRLGINKQPYISLILISCTAAGIAARAKSASATECDSNSKNAKKNGNPVLFRATKPKIYCGGALWLVVWP